MLKSTLFKILSVFCFPLLCFSTETKNELALSLLADAISFSAAISSQYPQISSSAAISSQLPQIPSLDPAYHFSSNWKEEEITQSSLCSTSATSHILTFTPKNIKSTNFPMVQMLSLIWEDSQLLETSIYLKNTCRINFTRKFEGLEIIKIEPLILFKYKVKKSDSYITTQFHFNPILEAFLKTFHEKKLLPLFFFKALQRKIPDLSLSFLNKLEELNQYINSVPLRDISSAKNYLSHFHYYLDLIKIPASKHLLATTFLYKKQDTLPPYIIFPPLSQKENGIIALTLLKYILDFSIALNCENHMDANYLSVGYALYYLENIVDNNTIKQIFFDSPYKNNRNDLILYYLLARPFPLKEHPFDIILFFKKLFPDFTDNIPTVFVTTRQREKASTDPVKAIKKLYSQVQAAKKTEEGIKKTSSKKGP